MNKKLKIALISRSSEQGFAIPIAIGLGLVMILIAATMIVRAQGDQVAASTQKATNRALSAAETGITRYQSLINNNPAIATYKDCDGTRDPTSGSCPDTDTTKSWANATKIPTVVTSSTLNSCSGGSGATYVVANSTTAWQNVNASDPSLGQFRLVSYVYPAPGTTGTTGTAPGTGQLTVEGQVNQSSSANTATTGVGTATTRLVVNIPVQNGDNTSVPFPGLWVTATTDSGNTNANILAPCDSTSVTVTASPLPATNNYHTYRTNLTIPSPPTKPTSNINTLVAAAGIQLPLDADISIHNTDLARNITNNALSNFNWATGEYQYSIPSISLSGSGNLTFKPGYKVGLYVDGNITMSGTPGINHDCTNTGGTLILNCSPTDARIYGLSLNGNLSLSGNSAICDVLFFAPNYTASVSGGGHAGSCNSGANNNGIYWIKAWSGGTSGPHISLQQTSATWNDVSFLFPLPPKIAPISSWQRQEAP